MKQTIQQPAVLYPLRVVKDQNEYRQQLDHLTSLAWQISFTALWNGQEFSTPEKEKASRLIKDFLQSRPNPLKAYAEYVQRVLLARQYILSHPGKYVPLPVQWLSPENKNGFAGTQRWYAAIENTRHSLPAFKQTLKAFPEAVLETVQSGKANDFHYWRSYFAEREAQGLLNLFLATLANSRF